MDKYIQIPIINRSTNPLPEYATSGSAGMDLRASIDAPIDIPPMQSRLIPTNLYTAIPEGYEVQVRSRSGLAVKNRVMVLNSPGTIDSDYRNSWGVILMNFGRSVFTVNPGDRIAQAVLNKVERIEWKEVTDLDETERGLGGFGHTGTN